MAWRARFWQAAALGTALWRSCAAGVSAQQPPPPDDWSLTRDGRPAGSDSKPRTRPSAAPAARGRELALALRAVDRRAAIEQLVATRGADVDALVREIETRIAESDAPRRYLLLLAQVQRVRGEPGQARASFERALGYGPDLLTLRLFAEFEREQQSFARARDLLDQALTLRSPASERLQLASDLLATCSALGDSPCAEKSFELLAREPAGVPLALSYPRALAAQRAHAPARAAYDALLSGKYGSPAAPATRCAIQLELGKLRLAESALEDARAHLELARVPSCRDQATDALELMLEVQRGLGSLAAFARELAANSAPRAQELAGRAFEELGQPSEAAAAYRRALAHVPDDRLLAERLIGLLTREGRIDEVVATYERLLAQPRPDPQFLSALTSLLRDTGRADQAVAAAVRVGRAQPNDVALHRLLVELYTRWELPDRARAELEWLTRIDPNEPSHVLALAESELAQGREAQAASVLRRLRAAAPSATLGHLQLGQAFADHELPRDALAEFEAALRLEPGNLAAMRGRAIALTRVFRHRDSEAQWQLVLASGAADAAQKRDAREQLVELWAELGELERRVRDFEEAFGYSAKSGSRTELSVRDPEVGRLLAEGYQRLARQPTYRAQPARHLRAAEDVLGQVVQLDPSDAASWRALDRLRSRRGDREGSIAALGQLVRLEPDRASEHFMRMAEYALAAFQHDAAIAYAEQAAEAAPKDASIQEWLGDVYRARRDEGRTIHHYQRALDLDPQRFTVALRLSELFVTRGDRAAARRLLFGVLASALQAPLVLRAGRMALQLASTPPDRAELERHLLVSSDPRRSEHRRVLIELYEALLPDLVARAADPDSRALLESIRARAQKPLLDALGDSDPAQVQSAVRLLRSIGTASAALPLLSLAEGDADLPIRRSALAAACAFGGAELLPRHLALSQSRDIRLRDMAAYCLARSPTPAAAPALRKLIASETPAVRALAAIGLGQLGARDQPTSASTLRLTLTPDMSALVRAAAAIGIGLLGDRVARSAPYEGSAHELIQNETPEARSAREEADRRLGREALERALRGPDRAVAESAALALGLLGEPAAAPGLAQALFDARADVAKASELALRALECNEPLAFQLSEPEPEPAIALEIVVADARRAVSKCGATSLILHFAPLVDAVRQALRGPDARRLQALAWLLRLEPASLDPLASEADAAFRAELLSSIASDLAAVTSHREASVRRDVARLLARTPVTAAERALFGMVTDPELDVRGAALDALAQRKLPEHAPYCERLALVAGSDPAFGMRHRAVQALGGMRGPSATRVLVRVLSSDRFALVRESAAQALSGREANLVAEPLLLALRNDAELRVRRAAARSLRQVGGALLHEAREDPRLPHGLREILQAR